MNSKKCVSFLLLIFILAFSFLAGCGGASSGASNSTDSKGGGKGGSGKNVTFSFYEQSSLNVKEFWEKVIPMFEDKYPNINVDFVYVPPDAPHIIDRMIAAKKAGKGSGGVDVMEAGIADIIRGQSKGLWETLKTAKIPNLSKVSKKSMEVTDYNAIPYRASAVILAYNGDKVKNPPKTLDGLYDWIRQHPGQFAYNDPSTGGSGSSFVNTAVYKYLPEKAMTSNDPKWKQKWDKGFNLLKELGKFVYGKGIYPKKNQGTLDLLANGEVDMIPAWSDMALQQIDNGRLPPSTELAQLNPGFTGGPAYLVTSKLADENKKKAINKFFNFVLTPKVQSVVVKNLHGFPGINLSKMPQQIQDQLNSVDKGYRIMNIGELGDALNKRWQREVATK